jgi:hypothetical protein
VDGNQMYSAMSVAMPGGLPACLKIGAFSKHVDPEIDFEYFLNILLTLENNVCYLTRLHEFLRSVGSASHMARQNHGF